MTEATNQCATAFGGLYDFYIERPRLARLIGRAMWGVDLAPMYADIDAVARLDGGAEIVDVPCGGGLALRGLSPGQDVRLIGIDIDKKMLDRMRRRANERGLDQVETLRGDMRALPLGDASVDHALCFSGLHMINQPQQAIDELARVVRTGGTIVGSSFVARGSLRWRILWQLEKRHGIARPPEDASAIEQMLASAGFDEIDMAGGGFVTFRAVRGK